MAWPDDCIFNFHCCSINSFMKSCNLNICTFNSSISNNQHNLFYYIFANIYLKKWCSQEYSIIFFVHIPMYFSIMQYCDRKLKLNVYNIKVPRI